MADIKNKLDSLLANKGLMRGTDWMQRLEEIRRSRESGELEIDRFVQGEVVGGDDSGFFLSQEILPLDTEQGSIPLGRVLTASGTHIALSASDENLLHFDPRTALFIDTETSGLAGGAGTIAFLVGVGYFIDEGFRLDQCFMRDFDDEPAMLEYLAERFENCETVVTYNGKAFDLPLLRTRFIQNRIPFVLDSAMHFDILFAARRFWKRRLGACNLANIERAILGIERHGDVPGYEIPQIWFDYVRTRDATRLPGVFYHHKMDILSLAALTAWISECLSTPHGEGFQHSEDRLSLVRVYWVQRRYDEVVSHGIRLLETDLDPSLRHDCLEMIALAGKRLGDFARMEESLILLLQEHPRDLRARLELAKHYEHRARNLLEAERMCAEAVDLLGIRASLGREVGNESAPLQQFQYRLERIRRKMAGGRASESLESES